MKNLVLSSAVIALIFLLSVPVISAQPADDEIPTEQIAVADHDIFFGRFEDEGEELDILFEPGMENAMHGDGRGGDKLREKLNLTDDQKSKINSMRTEHQKKMIDLRADLQKAKLEAREIRNSDNINRSAVIASVEKINQIKNEIALASANHRMDVYELLTPDQRKVWKEMRGDHPFREMKHKRKFFEHKMR